MQAVEPTTKGIALIAPGLSTALRNDLTGRSKMVVGVRQYTGYDLDAGQWSFDHLKEGWLPVVGVTLAWKGYHFVNKLIRRL